MPETSEKVGFEAYFETTEFERGLKKFLKGLLEAEGAMGSLFDAFGEANTALAKHTDTTATFGKKVGSILGSISGALVGMALGIPEIGASVGEMLGSSAGGLSLFLNMLGPVGVGLNVIISLFKTTGKIGSATFKGIGKAASHLFNIIGTVGKIAFNVFGTVATVALRGVLVLAGSVAAAVGSVLAGAFIILGRAAKRALDSVVRQFKELLDSAVKLQAIEVGLGAITRASLVIGGEFKRATDAMAAAIPITESLLRKITAISLSSPFSVEDVNILFRTLAAFGISLGMAVDLTEAMIELGAATGFSNVILERIARNFAQVARNGKIFQRDLYELANAGVDLHAVLDTQLNVTVEEMNRLLATGEMTVLDLIGALERFAKQYYGGSAEALSKTIQGLQTRFKTLGTVMINDFARPLMNVVAPALETIFDGMSLVVQTGVFEKIGQMFANLGRTIVGDVNTSVERVAQTILKFIRWLLQTTNKMIQFGYDMMTQWGYGMLRGAADAITAVAKFISSAMTRLFAPHSPPKILPLIDVWGAGLIEEWLKGMANADFGILDSVVSIVKSALSHLNVDEDVVYHQMQNIARIISNALKTGFLDEGLMSYITDIAGPFGKAIAKFTSLQFDLAKAIKATEIAQKALDDAFNMYERADKNVQKLVREYNKLLRAGAGDEVLDEKLKEINAEQIKRKEAALLIEKREEELETAKENRDALQDQVDSQKELISLMLKMTQPIKDAKEEAEKLGKEIANAAEYLKDVWGGLGDLKIDEWDFSPAINSLLDDIDVAIAEIEASFSKLWASVMSELGYEAKVIGVRGKVGLGAVGEPITKWVKTRPGIFDEAGQAIKDMFSTAINDIDWGGVNWAGFWFNLTGAISEALGGEGGGWDALKVALKNKLRDVLNDAGLHLKEEYSASDVFVQVGVEIGKGIIKGVWSYSTTNLRNNLMGIASFWMSAIKTVFDAYKPSQIAVGAENARNVIGGFLDYMRNNLRNNLEYIVDFWINVFRAVLGIDDDSSAVVRDKVGKPVSEGVLKGMIDTIKEKMGITASNIWTDISTELNTFIGKATDIGRNILTGLLGGIEDFGIVGGLKHWASGIIDKIKNALQDASDQGSPSRLFASEVGVPMAQGILIGMTDEMRGIKKDMFAAVNDLVNYQPTPTSVYTPSTISTHNVTYNMNMGGNIVRDDMDIAMIVAANRRAVKRASYGV